jgi:hypothetical protein
MATCPNCHKDPQDHEFCGHCGAALVTAVATCPHGHINAERSHFCAECGAPISPGPAAATEPPATRPWYGKMWVIVAATVLALGGIAGGAVAVEATIGKQAVSPAPTMSTATAIKQWWWSGAQQYFTDLQTALNDAKRAAKNNDINAVDNACQRIHDISEDKLKAHLPTPDPELTSELQGMIEDFHSAAHLCMAGAAGSFIQAGDLMSYLDEAERQMKAAQDMVNNYLDQASSA